MVTNIFDKEVLIKHNLTFDTNLSYRSDEKFLTDYYTHHKYVVFLDKLLYVWNSHYNNRYSYQNTKNLYFDTVIVNDYYYNNIVKKTYHKSRTNFIMYLHMISVLLMGKIKKILKHKNVPEMKIIDVKEFFNMHILKNSLLFYLSFSLIPLYIAYYYFNVITNFKFFIKTK
ncbi:MAG: hypothetical protein LBD88_04530 [Candidatus Peribacteria bacterium]|nr:hypothetical protein [Candidatus Peribacteria bacterium]